jgi:hypothetical protein
VTHQFRGYGKDINNVLNAFGQNGL